MATCGLIMANTASFYKKLCGVGQIFYFYFMNEPVSGALLISDPFLKDPNFMRTVVFLCEHNDDGAFGFVLNRPYEETLDEFLPEISEPWAVNYGGPVQTDTLHFLHRIPAVIPGGQQVVSGIYWGGDFEAVVKGLKQRSISPDDIRFYIGYSGWSAGQLEEEIEEKSWLLTMAKPGLVFHNNPGAIWPGAIKQLDDKYHPIMHYPIDPQLN